MKQRMVFLIGGFVIGLASAFAACNMEKRIIDNRLERAIAHDLEQIEELAKACREKRTCERLLIFKLHGRGRRYGSPSG